MSRPHRKRDSNDPLARYIAALRQAGADPSAEEIADALWLSFHIDPQDTAASFVPPMPGGDTPADNRADSQGVIQLKEPPTSQPASRPAPQQAAAGQARPGADLFPGVAGEGEGRSGALFNTAMAKPLPGTTDLARALRPFRRRVPSKTIQRIDEQATATRTAEERVLNVITRPVRTRWLAVDLVIDESSTMVVWRRTALAFHRLLVQLGAFHDVRIWGLNADSAADIRLYAGPPKGRQTQQPHSLNELVDPGGRRLILLLSDCVSQGWHSGAVARAISGWPGRPDAPALVGWARNSPLALVQVLPPGLWRRTSLARETRVRLGALLPGVPNTLLRTRLDDPELDPDDELPSGIPVPVFSLDPQLMGDWSRLVGGMGAEATGFILNPTGRTLPAVSPIRKLDARQRIQGFIDHASPEAQNLALLLAALPVTLPVINLVQETQLPGTRQWHAAEVLLSGLLRQVTPPDAVDDPNEIEYEFVEGVRELLLEAAVVRAADVVDELSAFVARRLGHGEQMQARAAGIGGPTMVGGGARRKFARLSPALMRLLGLRPADEPVGQLAEQPVDQLTEQPAAQPGAQPAEPKIGEQGAATSAKKLRVYDAQGREELPGKLMRREGQPPTGDVAVDEAYAGLSAFYDFFWEVFQRNSIDNAGQTLQATVHHGASVSRNSRWWDPVKHRLVFGDPDGSRFKRLTSALDGVAAGVAHGVVWTELRLKRAGRGEAGALQQSLAETFGLLVKQYALRETVEQTDWLFAAGILESHIRGVALRSWKAPGTAYDDPVIGKDSQVAHMRDFVRADPNSLNLYTNSGIPNHAFYLVASRLGGYAWEKAGRIWYDALRSRRLRPTSGFLDFAGVTLHVAQNLYGADSDEARAVYDAWEAVGITLVDRRPASVPPPEVPRQFTQGHALVIGIGTWRDIPTMTERGTVTARDAEAVAAALSAPDGCAYPPAQVTLLTHQTATRYEVLNALEVLAARAGEADTVVIFYSGHYDLGDDGHHHMTTYDSRMSDDQKVFARSAIREDEILRHVAQIRAQEVLLLFTTSNPRVPDRFISALLSTGKGRAVIVDCREGQRAYFDRRGQLTIFGEALVAALRGAAPGRDGYLRLFDMYEYVYSRVSTTVRQRWNLDQEPELTIMKGVGSTLIGLHPVQAQADSAATDAPAPEEPQPQGWVREVQPTAAMVEMLAARGTDTATSEVETPGPNTLIKAVFGQVYVLLIGVDSYRFASHLDAPILANDASEVAATLRRIFGDAIDPADMTMLTGADATRAGMLRAMDQLASKAETASTFFVFYAGHSGYDADGTYVLAAHDTRVNDGKYIGATGMREQELAARLARLTAKNVIVIVNSSHSGELTKILGHIGARSGGNRAVITACRSEQNSHYRRGDTLTIFTQVLVNGLSGQGVAARRGFVGVYELYDYLREEVSARVKNEFRRDQEPALAIDTSTFFPIAPYVGQLPSEL